MKGISVSTPSDFDALFLPGVPADYLSTSVMDAELRSIMARVDVLRAILADRDPLPTTEAREGYFGPRHLEYWLSGRRDAERVAAASGLGGRPGVRALDFGGATGRVARHLLALCSEPELYLSDINADHVACVQRLFGGRIRALTNRGVPSLPLPDRFLDVAYAFSVLTHLDAEDTAWLLELRRVVRPGGTVYVTVHDEATWDRLPDLAPMNPQFAAAELLELRRREPALPGKVVHHYNDSLDYACNAFVSRRHIEEIWAPLFASWRLESMTHDHQAALVFQVPM